MKTEFSPEQQEAKKLHVGAESLESPEHKNQDAILVNVEHGTFGVFDGLGGYDGAEVAATLARDVVKRELSTLPQGASFELEKEAVRAALRVADQEIKNKAREDWSLRHMCTTATILKVWQSKGGRRSLIVGNVGDSHAYHLNVDGNFAHITEGVSALNQAVGSSSHPISPQVITVDLVRTGDRVLICSDGVYAPLTMEELKGILDSEHDPEMAARKLASMGQEKARKSPYEFGRSPDDASAIVIRF